MNPIKLHEDDFSQILWDGQTRIMEMDWKESNSAMTDMDYMTEVSLFADYVEQNKASSILVDITTVRLDLE